MLSDTERFYVKSKGKFVEKLVFNYPRNMAIYGIEEIEECF